MKEAMKIIKIVMAIWFIFYLPIIQRRSVCVLFFPSFYYITILIVIQYLLTLYMHLYTTLYIDIFNLSFIVFFLNLQNKEIRIYMFLSYFFFYKEK